MKRESDALIWREDDAKTGLPHMRITIVSDSIDNSGGFRVVSALGQQLLASGHDVRIVAPTKAQPGLRAKLRAIKYRQTVRPRRQHSDHLGSLQYRTTVVPHLAPLVADDFPDADLIIATWWATMNWLEELPPTKGTPVHLVQDYETWGGPSHSVDHVMRMGGPKVAISTYLHKLLTDTFGQRDVLLLPNAVDHTLFHAAPRSKQKTLTMGFVYAPDPRKGTDLILKALQRVRQAMPNIKVVAFGHHAPTKELPLPSWINYTVSPQQETLRAIYASCDIWLFGSRQEGFGLPILEAMACRTPVIGLNAGAAADLIDDDTGILLDNEDWTGMADAILRIGAMSEEEWRAYSDRAHHRAAEQNWDRVGSALEHWLADVVARPRSR